MSKETKISNLYKFIFLNLLVLKISFSGSYRSLKREKTRLTSVLTIPSFRKVQTKPAGLFCRGAPAGRSTPKPNSILVSLLKKWNIRQRKTGQFKHDQYTYREGVMRVLFLIIFSGVFSGVFLGDRAFSCNQDVFRLDRSDVHSGLWRGKLFRTVLADKSAREMNNEELLRILHGDTQSLFGLNFMRDRITGENSYVLIKPYKNPRIAHIGRIREKTGPDRLVVEIRLAPGELKSFETSLQPVAALIDLPSFLSDRPDSKALIEQANPRLSRLFEENPSPRKIDSSSLNIPEQSDRERKLKERGFGPVYTRGLDQAQEWMEIGKSLRKLNADPYKTSVDYYADQIPSYIEYMERGVVDSKQREELDYLKEQAALQIKEGKVTYEWWVKWTFSLTLALDPVFSQSGGSVFKENKKNTARIKSVIDQYPLNILMPAPPEVFGIMLANEVYAEGVFPVSLANREGTVDGIKNFPPSQRYLHDIGHAENFLNRIGNTYSGTVQKRLSDRLKKIKETLPPKTRKKVELGHYILEHEMTAGFVSNAPIVQETLLLALSHQIREGFNFKGLMNISGDAYEDRDAIHGVKDAFMEVFRQIQTDSPDGDRF